MYFPGKLVYLIVRASNQLAVTTTLHFAEFTFVSDWTFKRMLEDQKWDVTFLYQLYFILCHTSEGKEIWGCKPRLDRVS